MEGMGGLSKATREEIRCCCRVNNCLLSIYAASTFLNTRDLVTPLHANTWHNNVILHISHKFYTSTMILEILSYHEAGQKSNQSLSHVSISEED
jgi:hypothetical protein